MERLDNIVTAVRAWRQRPEGQTVEHEGRGRRWLTREEDGGEEVNERLG